ncbi:MAG: hypothetical protein V3W20_13390 [Candidatus Neomarinimicrobiota bacterium]
MPQQQQEKQATCFLVMGIVLAALGFYFWVWFLMAIGGFLFIMGICLIIQLANKPKTTEAQPAAQPVAQPAPAPINEAHLFCPHCGAKTTGKYCTSCGSEID